MSDSATRATHYMFYEAWVHPGPREGFRYERQLWLLRGPAAELAKVKTLMSVGVNGRTSRVCPNVRARWLGNWKVGAEDWWRDRKIKDLSELCKAKGLVRFEPQAPGVAFSAPPHLTLVSGTAA